MRSSLAVTVLSLLAAATLSVALVELGVPSVEEPISHNARAVPVEDAEEYTYVLREYQGRLAVFSKGSSEPDLVFNVFVQGLPDFDQGQLQNGVAARDYAELVELIEDYTS